VFGSHATHWRCRPVIENSPRVSTHPKKNSMVALSKKLTAAGKCRGLRSVFVKNIHFFQL
jgi:hypothetical protein